MERCISVISRLALLVTVSVLALQTHAEDRTVVLVTGNGCPMNDISALDIRKAYLGIGVSYERQSIWAFRLNNDAKLSQVFFQNVVAMSEKTYERRLISLLLQYGRPRPREFDSVEEMVSAMTGIPCGVGYMWQSELDGLDGIKAIRILWQEN